MSISTASIFVIIVVTIVMVMLQYWFFEHTMLGKKLQATSQDKEMASLLGISVLHHDHDHLHLRAVLGGLAGILVAPILFVSVQMGSTIALKAFAATIIGGFGDVTGAIVGGLALGVIETFGAAYISVPYKDGFAFLVLVLFLLLPAARHLRRTRRGESMSAPSDNMTMAATPRNETDAAASSAAISSPRDPGGAGRQMPFDGYILNILMQATTYAIAVFGLTVVLGYAGRSIWRRRRSSASAPKPSLSEPPTFASELLARPRGRRLRHGVGGGAFSACRRCGSAAITSRW